jgi:membrane protease YdiL (CAAX protease family)
MKLAQAIFSTILFYLFIELINFWVIFIPIDGAYLWLVKSTFLINDLITLILLILLFKLFKRTDLLEFKKTEPKYYLIAVLAGIGFVFFQSILNIIYYREASIDYFFTDFTLERLTSLNVLASIAIVPITEELVFRNYILRDLLKDNKPAVAIIISSLLFAFIHLPIMGSFLGGSMFSFHHAYITLFGGLIAGILFYKSKSIIPSIIFHVFWNLASYVFY